MAVQFLSSNSCLGQLCLHAAAQQIAAYKTCTLCMNWSPGIQTSGQLMILMLVLQDVGLDAATAGRLGLRREDVQQPELASKPNLRLQDTLELTEYPDHKASSRTVVLYRLVAVVFRSGGFSGHYYVAVQASPDSWVVLNSEQTSGPYSLDEVQAVHGKHIYVHAQVSGAINVPSMDSLHFVQAVRP